MQSFEQQFLIPNPYSPIPIKYVMIKVTRLDGKKYYVNPHQIECIEIQPDTVLVMLSGKTHIVREQVDDVLNDIETYRRRLNPYVAQE